MKKRLVMILLSIGLMIALLGCDKKENKDNKDNKDSETTITPENPDVDVKDNISEGDDNPDVVTSPVSLDEPVVKEDYKVEDYIKLGKYKGIEVKLQEKEVTDKDIDVAIQMELQRNGIEPIDVTDRAAKFADTINIDFAGYHNGELFEGGTAEGYPLLLGSGAFIEGFEDQLIGGELNKEMDINVVFPENYMNTDLAGEPVLFKVTINGIQSFELTDDFVKNTVKFDTEEAYRESLRQILKDNVVEGIKRQKENDLYNAVINGSEITLPDNLLAYYEYDLKAMYFEIAESYGVGVEEILGASGYTMEQFDADAKEYAKSMATRELVVKAISKAEGIELTDEEFQTEAAAYAASGGYESTEEFLEGADEDILKEDMLFNKIIKFIVGESKEI